MSIVGCLQQPPLGPSLIATVLKHVTEMERTLRVTRHGCHLKPTFSLGELSAILTNNPKIAGPAQVALRERRLVPVLCLALLALLLTPDPEIIHRDRVASCGINPPLGLPPGHSAQFGVIDRLANGRCGDIGVLCRGHGQTRFQRCGF